MPPRLDITGHKYGRLAPIRYSHTVGKRAKWLCKCDCGNEAIVGTKEMRSDNTISCGCLASRKSIGDRNFLDITGHKYGRLTVLRYVKSIKQKSHWFCQCDCGKSIVVGSNSLRRGNTRSCGCLHIEGLKRIASGPNNWNWKGGITPALQKIKDSEDYRNWRKAVFERDGYTCQNCGAHTGNGKAVFLNAHHIESFTRVVEKRFDINNGITLCDDCHKIEHRKAA